MKKSENNNSSSNCAKVLLVDDKPGNVSLINVSLINVSLIERMLRGSKTYLFELVSAEGTSAGMERLSGGDIDAVLLNLSIQGCEALDTFRKFNQRAPELPTLILADQSDEVLAIQTAREGAEDFLVKGHLESDLLVRAICIAIERKKSKEVLRKTMLELEQSVIELKKANRKVIEQQKSIIKEERIKVILEMAGATAHEIKQPLTAILGYLDLMRMFKDVPPELEKYISEIESAAEKTSRIVSSMHEISKYESKSHAGDVSSIKFDQCIYVLSIEDSDQDFINIQTALKEIDSIHLIRARNFNEAQEALEQGHIDVILLDYLLPDGNGLNFMRNIKTFRKDIPFIVITGHGDEIIASRFIQEGALDYFPKRMISTKSLSRSISNTLEKARLQREVIQAQKRLAEMSTKDGLTSLYNRRYFMEALEKEIARARRLKTELVLCMLDLDYFKKVNDTYGHPAGDMVLTEIARLLRESIRLNDYSCRYGGEEFTVILPNTSLKRARAVCERFRELVAGHSFRYNSEQFRITISIGLSHYNGISDQSVIEMVSAADQALYKAKSLGRNRVI